MGMFDELKLEKPTPDGWTGTLQTKDLDCCLYTHRIDADGKFHRGYIEYASAPVTPEMRSAAQKVGMPLTGHRRVHIDRPEPYHGVINAGDGEREYNIELTRGVVTDIRRVA